MQSRCQIDERGSPIPTDKYAPATARLVGRCHKICTEGVCSPLPALSARHSAMTTTESAPLPNNSRAAIEALVPVVTTSSTKTTRPPQMSPRARIRPARLTRRCLATARAWRGPGRRDNVDPTGRPCAEATAEAHNAGSENPRRTRRVHGEGTHDTSVALPKARVTAGSATDRCASAQASRRARPRSAVPFARTTARPIPES